jgi:hypothetical protein
LIASGQALDGGDGDALLHDGQREAGEDPSSLDQHGAGAALAVIAALLRTRERDLFPERVQECHARLEVQAVHSAVDGQLDRDCPSRSWRRVRGRLRGSGGRHLGQRGKQGHSQAGAHHRPAGDRVARREGFGGALVGRAAQGTDDVLDVRGLDVVRRIRRCRPSPGSTAGVIEHHNRERKGGCVGREAQRHPHRPGGGFVASVERRSHPLRRVVGLNQPDLTRLHDQQRRAEAAQLRPNGV